MKFKLKLLGRILELIVADSKLQNTSKSNYLQGSLMNTMWGNVSMFDTIKMIIGRLGKQIVIEINYKRKRVVIILLYRILQSSSNGVYLTLTQYNKMDGKAKTIVEYHNEIFDKMDTDIEV